ncbi:DMT family transporter [Pelagibius sp. Alg239-R121]|uniref:DMT family transporter n=1 Tax=Pelagibius sp. Alg239-R121 TaxID=2993448 RepID=UPI0024A73466|nr:DMT family transporter [Pelagibius sp. Alg239-R121]
MTLAQTKNDRVGLGIAYAVAGMLMMSIMDTIVKWLSTGYPVSEIVLFRNVFGLLPLLVALAMTGGPKSLRSPQPVLQVLRAFFALGAGFMFFAALRTIPLADAFALAFTGPLFITALSVPLLREQVGIHRWSAVILGFIGTLVILRPAGQSFDPAAFLVIGAALCYAMVMILTRRLAPQNTTLSMMVWTATISLLISGAIAPFEWVTPSPLDFTLLALMGLIGSAGMFMIGQGYRYAPAAVIAPFDYSILIWGVLFGWILWQELPDRFVWAGAAIVIASGIYIVRRETRLSQIAQQ